MPTKVNPVLWPPFKRTGTTITQRTSGDTINSTGNLTFATGLYIASGSTNTNTLTINANDTAFITLTTGATDSCEANNITMKGTWIASGTVTMPALTLGGAIAGGDQSFTGVGDMTFTAGSILASGSSNGNTLLINANDTTFITLTTGATDTCDLASGVTIGSAYIYRAGGTDIPPADGGTGVSNGSNNTITFTGNFTLGLTLTNNTSVTLPTTGTLATTADLGGYLPLTGGTMTGALITAPTATGTLHDFVLETEWTTGTLINADFGGATTQSGDMYGLVMDFNTNLAGVTDKDVKAIVVSTPALTQSTANTTNYAVIDVSTSGALVQNTLVGTITWTGVNLQMPNITQTTGIVNSYGIYVNGGTVTSGTQWTIFVDSGNVRLDGTLGDTTNRVLSGWFTDLTVTNKIAGSITGNCDGTAATVTGATQASITTCANLVTVGTIGTGVWQGTTIKANYLQQAAADLGDADITVDFTNSNAGNVTNLTIDGTFTTGYLAATTLSGNLTLASGGSIMLPAGEMASDHTWAGITETGTGGGNIAIGDVVSLHTDGEWYQADCSIAHDTAGDARRKLGIAVTTSTDGNPITVLLWGKIRHDAFADALLVGDVVYVSTTAGAVTVTQPATTDDVIRIIGYGNTDDELFFCPSPDWITRV